MVDEERRTFVFPGLEDEFKAAQEFNRALYESLPHRPTLAARPLKIEGRESPYATDD